MKVRLRWKDFNRGQAEFRVYRDTQTLDTQSLPAPLVTLGPDVREYLDDPVLEGVTHHYLVSVMVDGSEYFAPEQQITPQASQVESLWENGEDGFWHVFSDSTTLFQDAAFSTPAGTGDPVGGVLDKTGNGNHSTQPTNSRRPVLTSVSGEYWAQFNGTSQGLHQPFQMSPQGVSRWIAILFQRDSGSASNYLIHGEGTKNARNTAGFTFLLNVSGEDEVAAGGINSGTIISPTNRWPTSASLQVVQFTFDKSTGVGYMRRDGTEYPLSVGTQYTNGEITTIGYRTPSSPAVFFKGRIYAVMAGDRMTSVEERNIIDNYLMNLIA